MSIELYFNSTSALENWLSHKNFSMQSAEAYSKWLHDFFEQGNSIQVRDEYYDYWSCLELI